MEKGIIYIATNLINKKQYIGQTIQPLNKRKSAHIRCNGCKYFHRAIEKYGIMNFKWIHFDYPVENLDWAENFLIKELNTLVPYGYNLNSGGETNKTVHELTKQKIKKALLGKPLSEEHKEKIKRTIKNYFQNNPQAKEIHAKKLKISHKRRKKQKELENKRLNNLALFYLRQSIDKH